MSVRAEKETELHLYKMGATNLPPSALCQGGSDLSSDPRTPDQMFAHHTAPSFWGSGHQMLLQLTGPKKKKRHVFMWTRHTVSENRFFSDVWVYLVFYSCPSNDLTSNSSNVWVKFKSDEFGMRWKQAGDAHRGVTTVGPQLQHCCWVYLRHHWVKDTACGQMKGQKYIKSSQLR